MIDYTLEPQEYMNLKVESMQQEDVKELAYFLWCFFGEDQPDLMIWRKEKLLPLLAKG